MLQGLCVRTDVGGQDLNFRRSDAGELRDGQIQHGDRADEHHEDRDHYRDNGAIDEEF